jgi:hypothetical protein
VVHRYPVEEAYVKELLEQHMELTQVKYRLCIGATGATSGADTG